MTEPADGPSAARPDPTDITQEEAWIEVIHKMDETYADPVRHQAELEEKNSALEEANRFIASVQAAMTADTPGLEGPGRTTGRSLSYGN